MQASIAQAQNDQENYYGDHIRLSVNIPATERDNPSENHCIRGHTKLIVIGQNETHFFVKLKGDIDVPGCNVSTDTIHPNIAYAITKENVGKSGPARTGVTYGALVIPFKWQTSGNKDFTGSASVGGYAGYRFEFLRALGITATPIAFAGASNISVPGATGANPQNVMGFSYGLGMIATFKGAFQLGGVIGWDRVGANTTYQYNNKPWIALEIGYAFLQ